MGVFVSFSNEGYWLHGDEFYNLSDLLLKAAGYLPHCPCGCSPHKLEWPDAKAHHQYKHGYVWRKTPKEALLTLIYKRECDLTGFYFIPSKHCAAIADRIDGLLGEIKKLDKNAHPRAIELSRAFRECAKYRRAVTFS